MIRSFGDKETKQIYNQERSKRLPAEIQERALIKLMLIDAAVSVSDLMAPPSNRLEKLKGDLENHWSIRINDQWRITLQFEDGNAYNVKITDYH
ncbi:MAG: type II toxin-antitoxin system RelE/ParE family toxin [Dethiobacteria bacterium]|nr:type II toxin-antitoxin system RelE/ParE family toxin [Bacillota bacterium]MDW7729943.1 type II toxin-antitoxin system RelE/ParE family toxin [Bacillota bacterium]